MTLLCEKEGENQGRKLFLCNGKWLKVVWILAFLLSVSYLKCNKGRESSSYQVYIQLCYYHVLVFLFFYKVKILSTLCFNFGVKNAFCHKMVIAIRR